ncbi:uncharacterized protein LOC134831112 [Culicoides brevitarsis]|uniref:uncharacterized protein LOC134831112 n=1 Tax=Culicoides brevitarsis TaxID=469753 RepID=UPI00307B8F7B
MEDFEINSNESQNEHLDKAKPEVNNNRSGTSNNKYNYEAVKIDVAEKFAAVEETRNGHEIITMENKSAENAFEETNSSENGELVEEIILLPNNFISDDELSSNSDDCVYAYRGGHVNLEQNLALEPENIDDGQDEETDFLEMDFDPEPNSEIENFIEDERHFNHLEANFFTLRSDEGMRELPCVSQLRQNGTGSPLDSFEMNEKDDAKEEKTTENEKKSTEGKENLYTGAKPKLVTSTSAHKLSSSSNSYTSKEPTTPETSFKVVSEPLHVDESCLECAEAEFIFQTKPEFSVERKCRRHRNTKDKVPSKSLSYSSPSEATTASCPVTHQEFPASASKSTENSATVTNASNSKEFMVTIYSINCDYETIVEATNMIGVQMNTEVLKQYFETLADEETATMSVPEYLLYVSKRNCNYKRLIDVIKTACQSPVDIHFYPHEYSSPTPEIVQIAIGEITQRWNRNTDLRPILKFKNKNFKSLNVLGKVVNAIRQYESGERLKTSNSHINIPQYYRSGYICITKLAHPVMTCS